MDLAEKMIVQVCCLLSSTCSNRRTFWAEISSNRPWGEGKREDVQSEKIIKATHCKIHSLRNQTELLSLGDWVLRGFFLVFLFWGFSLSYGKQARIVVSTTVVHKAQLSSKICPTDPWRLQYFFSNRDNALRTRNIRQHKPKLNKQQQIPLFITDLSEMCNSCCFSLKNAYKNAFRGKILI